MILEDNGNIFACSKSQGFYVNDGAIEKVFTTKDSLLSNKIPRIEKDNNGFILIATYEGPNKYKNGEITSLKYKGEIIKGLLSDILVGKDGTNYYASKHGLIID